MDATATIVRENLVKAWRFLYKRGFIEGFGHISARGSSPEQIFVSRHSLGLKACPADFVLLDLGRHDIRLLNPVIA